MWILEHAPPEYGYDDIATLHDADGNLLPKNDLKWIVKNLCHNHPNKITQLVKSFNNKFRVEFTPPYWPHCCPVELLWNNLKFDYRRWDSHFKVNQVSASVRSFLEEITAQDCEGWVRHTDDFCIKVAARDAATLKEYEIPGDLNL